MKKSLRIRIALLHLKAILVCNECELVHDWAEAVRIDTTLSYALFLIIFSDCRPKAALTQPSRMTQRLHWWNNCYNSIAIHTKTSWLWMTLALEIQNGSKSLKKYHLRTCTNCSPWKHPVDISLVYYLLASSVFTRLYYIITYDTKCAYSMTRGHVSEIGSSFFIVPFSLGEGSLLDRSLTNPLWNDDDSIMLNVRFSHFIKSALLFYQSIL